MTYRLAIDLGATSLGWCVLNLDNKGNICGLQDMGVRIFPDGRDAQSKEPMAVARRGTRGMSRRRDRLKRRQERLMDFMIENGLMPQGKQARKQLELKDPYELRAKALNEKISLHELGRALFHINQRRGFKSNRKTDRGDNESGAIKKGIAELEHALLAAGSRTLGEYLYQKNTKNEGVRARPHIEKSKAAYDFYPARAMYEHEIDVILGKQKEYHAALTDEICKGLKDIIFYQRPLKPQPVGWCTFESDEKRARLAYPVVQTFRILQEVNNLEIDAFAETNPQLTAEDRQKIIDKLQKSKDIKFNAIRKLLKLGDDVKFNFETTENRKGLDGNSTNVVMANKKRFGGRWYEFSEKQKNEIIDLISGSKADDEILIEQFRAKYGLSGEQAEAVVYAPLKDGYGRLSLKAISKMMPDLLDGKQYWDASTKIYGSHSDRRDGIVWPKLPYYGEALPESVIGGSYAAEDKDRPEKYYGKINNPTVHIALNQLRKLVNAVIDVYGAPREIAVELARELKFGRERLQKWSRQQADNQERNERINAELEKLGVAPNYQNRLQFKLWEDLAKDPTKRCCPFTGKNIGMKDIFSGEFQVEHLLPFSRSYNDSPANKVLAHRSANRIKANSGPYEAFGHTPEWEDILARADNLPNEKKWRFKSEAWDIAAGKIKHEGQSLEELVIARQLTDTQYMTRIAKRYLACVVEQQKGESRVYGIPGQLTSLLRDKWGLNKLTRDIMREEMKALFASKNNGEALVSWLIDEDKTKDRSLHVHHAIDAFVVGCTTRGMLQAIAREANKMLSDGVLWENRHKLAEKFPQPFDGYIERVRDHLQNMIVSYKPDHGNAHRAISALRPYTVSGLHQETAYGLVGPGAKKDMMLYVTRKAIDGFTKRKDIEAVADSGWRKALLDAVGDSKDGSAEFKTALATLSEKRNVRRLRVHVERSTKTMVPVYRADEKGAPDAKPYKYYSLGGNYCAEIYEIKHGKDAGKWGIEIISNYHAHQKDFIPEWQKDHPTARKLMRLQINDMMAYEEDGIIKICRVKKITNGRIYLRDHRIGNEEADKLSWGAYVNGLKEKNARKISVDIMGRVRDPHGKIPYWPAEITAERKAA